jgi:uncharacterized membrane protein (UPF0127 family)
MMILNVTRKTCVATTSRLADSFFSRLKGLLGTAGLAEGAALVITPCSSIHTFGMAYPIDVLFIGDDNKVLRIISSFSPGRAACCGNSRCVIELPAGAAEVSQTQVGDEITIKKG